MNIKLRIDGEYKTFTAPFVPAMVFRKFIELKSDMDFTDLKAKEIDNMVELIVLTFESQFTLDEFYNGIPSKDLMTTIEKYIVHGGEDEPKDDVTKKK